MTSYTYRGANRPRSSQSLGSVTSHQEQRWLNPSPWWSGGGCEVLLAVTLFALVLDDAFAYARRRLPWPRGSSTLLLWTFGMFLHCDFDWTYILYSCLCTPLWICTNTSLGRIACLLLKVLSSSLIGLRLATTAVFPLQPCCVVTAVLLVFADRKLARPPMRHPQLQNQDPHGTSVACCPWRCHASFHRSKSQASHIIGIDWNEWLDVHGVLWWLPYVAQKEN